jgi:hypothetical protein
MFRLLLTAFTITVIAVSVLAQSQAEHYVIEHIVVRHAQRVSPDVIVDETLLREGKEYSEDELRAAVARLNHLPFLLKADFALESGTEAGRRVLVINVTEMNRFSFVLNGRGLLLDERHSTIDRLRDYDFDRPGESNDAAALRWFAGDRGVVHVAMAVRRGRQAFMKSYSAWEIGYTRYDLFGTRLFATFNVRTPVDSVNERRISPQFIAGIPLTASQTLTVDYHDTSFVRESIQLFGTNLDLLNEERVISFAWTYDTTDLPYAPADGTLVRVAPVRLMVDRAAYQAIPRSTNFAAYADHGNTNGVDFAALHYWKLSDANSISGGVLAGWATTEHRIHPPVVPENGQSPRYQVVQAGYSRDLAIFRPKNGTSRFELEASFVRQHENSQHYSHAREFAVSWVRRSVLGTLRLGLAYERTN